MAMTRDEAMAKIRKLLAIGKDGRGNMNEAETAMRQAQALMRQYQIDSAEEVLADLKGGVDMASESESPYAYPAVDIPKTVPSWVSVISFGVARLTETKADIIIHRELGARVRFCGYSPDVQFARWLYRYLLETVHSLSVAHGGSRGARESFRRGAASVLQNRLLKLAEENEKRASAAAGQGAWDSKSTALVIIDAKKAAIAKQFGEMGAKQVKSRTSDTVAAMAGRIAGAKMNIPSNRPLEAPKGKEKKALKASAPLLSHRPSSKSEQVF